MLRDEKVARDADRLEGFRDPEVLEPGTRVQIPGFGCKQTVVRDDGEWLELVGDDGGSSKTKKAIVGILEETPSPELRAVCRHFAFESKRAQAVMSDYVRGTCEIDVLKSELQEAKEMICEAIYGEYDGDVWKECMVGAELTRRAEQRRRTMDIEEFEKEMLGGKTLEEAEAEQRGVDADPKPTE